MKAMGFVISHGPLGMIRPQLSLGLDSKGSGDQYWDWQSRNIWKSHSWPFVVSMVVTSRTGCFKPDKAHANLVIVILLFCSTEKWEPFTKEANGQS